MRTSVCLLLPVHCTAAAPTERPERFPAAATATTQESGSAPLQSKPSASSRSARSGASTPHRRMMRCTLHQLMSRKSAAEAAGAEQQVEVGSGSGRTAGNTHKLAAAGSQATESCWLTQLGWLPGGSVLPLPALTVGVRQRVGLAVAVPHVEGLHFVEPAQPLRRLPIKLKPGRLRQWQSQGGKGRRGWLTRQTGHTRGRSGKLSCSNGGQLGTTAPRGAAPSPHLQLLLLRRLQLAAAVLGALLGGPARQLRVVSIAVPYMRVAIPAAATSQGKQSGGSNQRNEQIPGTGTVWQPMPGSSQGGRLDASSRLPRTSLRTAAAGCTASPTLLSCR